MIGRKNSLQAGEDFNYGDDSEIVSCGDYDVRELQINYFQEFGI